MNFGFRSAPRITSWFLGIGLLGAALLAGCQGGEDPVGTCRQDCGGDTTRNIPDMRALLHWDLGKLPLLEQLDSSRKALEILKEAAGNSYSYGVGFHSLFGYARYTRIKVQNGIVTERQYADSSLTDDATHWVPGASYTEIGSEVGRNSKGFPPKVLDTLYAECVKTLAAAGDRDEIYFSLDSNYILDRCQYLPYGCADDCTRGNAIGSLTWGP